MRQQPVRAVCRQSVNSELLEACGGNGDVFFLVPGDFGLILLCFLYRKRSERLQIPLMKPSNSSSVKFIIESLLSFSSFFLFSLLPLSVALCLLCLLHLNFFFSAHSVSFRCSSSLCWLAVPQMNKQRLGGEKRLPVSVLGV